MLRQVYKWLRREQKYRGLLAQLAARSDSAGCDRPDDIVESRQVLAEVARQLADMPQAQRECFLRMGVEGRTAEETALVLEMTPAAVRRSVSRVRARLRKCTRV